MSTGGTEHTAVPLTRGVLILICCLCLATTLSMVAVAASLVARSLVASPPTTADFFTLPDPLLVIAVSGAVALVIGLLVIHSAPRDGWPWLLVAGTVLTGAMVLSESMMDAGQSLVDSDLFVAAVGAGPVLVMIGLLGAGNWLMHAASSGVGPVIAGAAFAAPLLGGVVVSVVFGGKFLVFVGGPADYPAAPMVDTVLVGLSIAGAIGIATMLPLRRRLPTPDRPAIRVTVVGLIAGVILLGPYIALEASGWSPVPDYLDIPGDESRVSRDDWSRLFGLAGLTFSVVAAGLASVLGSRALIAALCAGLVLYGTNTPMALATGPISEPIVSLVLALVGFALGGLAAATRRPAWFAGAACSAVGISTIIVMTTGALPSALAMVLLPLVGFAAVATVATVVAGLTASSQAPALIGAVAVAIQLGLINSGALLQHSQIAGDGRWAYDGVGIASGVALLLAAMLVVKLRLAPAAPADVEPPEQSAPALTPG